MKWQRAPISKPILIIIAIASLLALLLTESLYPKTKSELYQKKLKAAELMKQGMIVIREAKERKKLINREDDPNLTGMIGARFTEITTTLGPLQVKRTATNPNFAAVIVDMLIEAGVKPGDTVAMGFSGSFPSLNLASLAAAQALDLQPIAISGICSSTYGASDPEMTWLDMENLLYEKGIIRYRSVAASIGGEEDRGENISPLGRELALEAIRRNKIPLILENSFAESIKKRLEIYRSKAGKDPIKVFINSGGLGINIGYCPHSYQIPSGFSKRLPNCDHPQKGVVFHFAEQGVPIIHLLNIKGLASKYGLPIDPVPLPEPGEGRIFHERSFTYRPLLILLSLSLLVGLLAWKAKREEEPNGTDGTTAS